MSVSGSRAAADFNLDEFERRLRAAGAFPTGAEDPLFELARLVESSKPEPSSPVAGGGDQGSRARAPRKGGAKTGARGRNITMRSPPKTRPRRPPLTAILTPPNMPRTEPPAKSRAIGWTARISALAVAGVAMIGAVFALKGGVPGLPKQPPYIAAAQGPTKVAAAERRHCLGSERRRRQLAEGQHAIRSRQGRRVRGTAGRPDRAGVRAR